MIRESQILYENETHWVLDKDTNTFEVYRKTITHSERRAIIGKSLGLQRAIDEADRRHKLEKAR